MDISIIIWTVFFTLVVVYGLLCAYIYNVQERMIFEPTKLARSFKFEFENDYEEFFIPTHGGEINALLFKVEKTKGCIMYHHGNARDLSDWANNYKTFNDLGYDVFFYDYRGYGKSTGKLSEMALHQDARKLYHFLLRYYKSSEIIQYGRSLGTGIATRLAARVGASMLLLETPYYSMRAMASKTIPFVPVSLLLKFPIRTDWSIVKVRCNIHIFHGMKDELVPFKHSLRLKRLVPSINLVAIQHGKHSDLGTFEEYHHHLKQILQ